MAKVGVHEQYTHKQTRAHQPIDTYMHTYTCKKSPLIFQTEGMLATITGCDHKAVFLVWDIFRLSSFLVLTRWETKN